MAYLRNTMLALFACLPITLCSVVLAADEPGDIRLALTQSFTKPVEVGQPLELSIQIAYRNLPKDSRIYAHLLTLAGDQWITVGGATFSMSEPVLNLSGSFADNDRSVFRISESNFPISMLISKDSMSQMFNRMGLGKKSDQFADAISSRKEGYDLTLAFLAPVSVEGTGFAEAKLSFLVPDYPQYYDSILIAPFVFKYEDTGSQTVSYNGKTMTSIRVPILPNRPKPLPTKENETLADADIPGRVLITRYAPDNAVLGIGTLNSLNVSLHYEDLLPGTAIYVAMIPATGDKYIFSSVSFALSSFKLQTPPDFIEGASKRFRIPKEAKPLLIPFYGGEELEAALVAVVKEGGTGDLAGPITFVPPVYARKYQRIHFLPILLIPTRLGLRAVIDLDRFRGPRVLVSGG